MGLLPSLALWRVPLFIESVHQRARIPIRLYEATTSTDQLAPSTSEASTVVRQRMSILSEYLVLLDAVLFVAAIAARH